MVQVLRLLRRLPVAQKVEDIAIFINRELLPFLQELRESTAATFEQVTTNRLLGRDTPGTGDVEEISLDDTLEFTGAGVIQRAAITGDVTIPAGSNDATIPELAGILSDIAVLQTDVDTLEGHDFVTFTTEAALTNERVLTSGTNTAVSTAIANQIAIDVDNFPLTGLADQAAETFNGNFTAGLAPPTARAGSSVAGDGLTYTAGGTLAVGAGNGITVGADSVSITLPVIHTQSVTGTLNAHVLPTALAHGDTLIFSPTGATTLNGIDLQNALAVDWPEGFEFVLHNSSASFDVTVIDEAGTATALDRISTPVNQTIILGQSCSLIMRRFVTRWGAIERGWPEASTTLTYSGTQLQRAALTGFAAASANSNATTSAEPIVTYSSSGNMSAERVTTSSTTVTVSTSVANQIEFQRAALTGEVTASANSNTTAITRSTNFVWTGTHEFDNDAAFDDVVDIGHLLLTTGVFTLALSEGDNNDVAIGNVSVASFTTGVVNVLTGMVPAFNGQLVWIENSDDNASFSIAHDSTSTAANRFYCPHGQTLIISASTGVWARYNGTLSRWIIADSKEWKGLNVRDTPSLHTGIGTLDVIEGNGITLTHSASGTSPERELDLTIEVDSAADFTWTGAHTFDDSTTFNAHQFRYARVDDVASTGTITTYTIASTTSTVLMDTAGTTTIRGATALVEGQRVTFIRSRTSGFTVTFNHEDGSAANANNRFNCPNNAAHVLTNAGDAVTFQYIASRWRYVGN
jgi:hypothetical protein